MADIDYFEICCNPCRRKWYFTVITLCCAHTKTSPTLFSVCFAAKPCREAPSSPPPTWIAAGLIRAEDDFLSYSSVLWLKSSTCFVSRPREKMDPKSRGEKWRHPLPGSRILASIRLNRVIVTTEKSENKSSVIVWRRFSSHERGVGSKHARGFQSKRRARCSFQ